VFGIVPRGVGILLGSLTLGFEERRFSKFGLIFAGFLGMGLMLIALSFIEHFDNRYWYYAFFGFCMGYFNAHIFAPSHSLLQTHAVSHMRGRIYGSLYVLLQIAATLPTIIIGLLADKIPITYIATVLGVVLILFGVGIWTKLDKGQDLVKI